MSTDNRWICKREDDAQLICCSQKIPQFFGEDSRNSFSIGNACQAALASTPQTVAPTRKQMMSNVEDGAAQGGSPTSLRSPSSDVPSLKNLSTRTDEKFQPLFFGAEAERSAADCEDPEKYLIPCRQIKIELHDSFEPAAEVDGKSAHLTTVKCELTEDAVSHWNAMPESDVKRELTPPFNILQHTEDSSSITGRCFSDGGEGIEIKNCSVVLHPLDTSLLRTLPSPCDPVALTDKLKTRAQNCTRCKLSFRVFHGSTDLKAHEEHGDRPTVKDGVAFERQVDLKEREQIHTAEGPRQHLRDKINNRNEQTDVHEGIPAEKKLYPCSYRQKSFTQLSNQESHERTHTGERPHECSCCDKKFTYAISKVRHERTHTGERPYQCSFCDKRFSRTYYQKCHEKTHTGKNPYQCSFCDKTFSTFSNQKCHERTHTGEKPFQCSFCEKQFRVREHKTKHERTHTPENGRTDVHTAIKSLGSILLKYRTRESAFRPKVVSMFLLRKEICSSGQSEYSRENNTYWKKATCHMCLHMSMRE